MPKVDDARAILAALGLPPAQQADVAAYTLLALADVRERSAWKAAKRRSVRIHDIIVFLKDAYRKAYAENSRETIRRRVIHQLEQARVVDRNPDDPTLPTNDPRTHYALSDDALKVIRTYDTRRFAAAADAFQKQHGSLLAVYRAARERHLIPLTLPSGKSFTLSPGKHNQLQADIITNFGPRFAAGALTLYLGDTQNKSLHLEPELLRKLGVPVTKHDKLPDVVLYVEKKNWLFLIEAVTSHGPVSPSRFRQLETILHDCRADRIYVSAFPNVREFKRHVHDIAWETEVWMADMPDHMIHFNGDKFLGPPEKQ